MGAKTLRLTLSSVDIVVPCGATLTHLHSVLDVVTVTHILSIKLHPNGDVYLTKIHVKLHTIQMRVCKLL